MDVGKDVRGQDHDGHILHEGVVLLLLGGDPLLQRRVEGFPAVPPMVLVAAQELGDLHLHGLRKELREIILYGLVHLAYPDHQGPAMLLAVIVVILSAFTIRGAANVHLLPALTIDQPAAQILSRVLPGLLTIIHDFLHLEKCIFVHDRRDRPVQPDGVLCLQPRFAVAAPFHRVHIDTRILLVAQDARDGGGVPARAAGWRGNGLGL